MGLICLIFEFMFLFLALMAVADLQEEVAEKQYGRILGCILLSTFCVWMMGFLVFICFDLNLHNIDVAEWISGAYFLLLVVIFARQHYLHHIKPRRSSALVQENTSDAVDQETYNHQFWKNNPPHLNK